MAKLDDLRELLASGQFHHATYRNQGTLWEGLWIYRKDETGFDRGSGPFVPAFAFFKDEPELDAAHELVRQTGVSLGSYGQG